MALVKTDNSIVEIYGRFGGVYFKRGTDGRHVQAMPRVVKYTRSPAQQGAAGHFSPFLGFGITGFSQGASLWLLALIAGFAWLWHEYARKHLFQTKRGEKKHITGYNWYIYYALAFPGTHRPPFWKPPHSPSNLPDFIACYKGLWTYEHGPEEWPAESCSDYYWEGIPWNGRPSYKTDDFDWHIWWKPPIWVISPGPGFEPEGLTFYGTTDQIAGYYKNPVTKSWTHVYLGKPLL